MEIIVITTFSAIIPAVIWIALRLATKTSHLYLSYIALGSFYFVSFALILALDLVRNTILMQPECNDCEQGEGLGLAFLLIQVSTLYLTAAFIVSIAKLITTIKRRRHK